MREVFENNAVNDAEDITATKAELSGIREKHLLNILAEINESVIGTACKIADAFDICVWELSADEETYAVTVDKNAC